MVSFSFEEKKRLTPEEALKIYNKEKRGKLKIYLGYSPGVGKTYTMLREANIRVKRGENICIGYIEPHDRKSTTEQIGILEKIPEKQIEKYEKEHPNEEVPKRVRNIELKLGMTYEGWKQVSKNRYELVEERIKISLEINKIENGRTMEKNQLNKS